MHGPLQDIGLIDLLQLLERGQRSGILDVVGPDPTAPRVLRIATGRIIAIEPDASDAAVDVALIAQSLCAPESPREVSPGLRESLRLALARRALEEMLGWDRGNFDFQEQPAGTGPLDLAPESVVRALVSAEHRREELAQHLEAFRAIPDFAPADQVQFGQPPRMDPLDWRVLDAVDGSRNVAAIASRLEEPLEDVGERVLALMAETILELRPANVDVDVAARAAVQSGRYDDAVEQLRARVTSVPADHEAWRLLGLAEVGAGRFDHAIEAWSAWRSVAGTRAPEADALIHAARTMLEAMRDHRE